MHKWDFSRDHLAARIYYELLVVRGLFFTLLYNDLGMFIVREYEAVLCSCLCFMDDSRKVVPKVRDGKIHFIHSKIQIGKVVKSVPICCFITDIINYLSCKSSYHWMLNGIHSSIKGTRCIGQFYGINFDTFCTGKENPNVFCERNSYIFLS